MYHHYLWLNKFYLQGVQVPVPQTPLPPHSPRVETHERTASGSHVDRETSHTRTESKQERPHLSEHQKAMLRAKKVAAEKFKDLDVYHKALTDKDNKLHRFAVLKYLSKPKNLKKALANKDSPYHKTARRVVHRQKAKAYLADKKNFKRALRLKRHRFHKDAVKVYLTQGDHYEHALTHKKDRFHKAAVREYLLDAKTRRLVLSDKSNEFYKQALKLQKKINKRRSKSSTGDSSTTA